MTDTPKSLIQAVVYYSDLDRCEAKMSRVKWTDGKPECPACGSKHIGQIESRRMYQCKDKDCRKQFSVKVGTIFEDSPLGLDKWFVAVWCIANAKNGISSHELGRSLRITQKSAWFMLHRIREAMKTGTFRKLAGTVESDETFVGGKAENMHKHKREKKITGRGPAHMTAVQGIMQRGGDVRTFVVPNVEGVTLRTNVARNVEYGSKVYTDAATGYSGLARRFVHSTVDHVREYVRGDVHTNSVENVWCLFKRCIKGTWTHLAPFHVHRYAEEEAWRFNNRKIHDGARFDRLLSMVNGKQLTYRQLCAIDDCGFMGIE